MNKKSFFMAIILFFLCSLSFTKATAQKPGRSNLPRIGPIKNLSALSSDCGDYLLVFPPNNKSREIIFLSLWRGGGGKMNLDGRDVELTAIKSTLWFRNEIGTRSRSEYRLGRLKISVISEYKPNNTDAVRIIITNGRASRTISGVGTNQCGEY